MYYLLISDVTRPYSWNIFDKQRKNKEKMTLTGYGTHYGQIWKHWKIIERLYLIMHPHPLKHKRSTLLLNSLLALTLTLTLILLKF